MADIKIKNTLTESTEAIIEITHMTTDIFQVNIGTPHCNG